MAQRTVLTVWCGWCVEERRRDPGRLGRLREDDGRVRWFYGTRRIRDGYTGLVAWWRRDEPSPDTLPASDTLPAHCRRHGRGSVPTADVIGKRGRLLVKFTATAPGTNSSD